MQDGSLDSAPIWTDLRTFDPEPWRGKVDILGDVYASPDASNHELADTECERGQGRELYARDEPKTLGRGEASSSRSSGKAGLGDAELADTAGTGSQEPRRICGRDELRAEKSAGMDRRFEHQGRELADTEHEGHTTRMRPETTSNRGGQNLAEPQLADTDDAGLQGWDECGDGARERAARTSSPELGELPLFPPGPNDHAGWQWLLA